MNKKHEDANEPLIGQIAEYNQEDGKRMMKSILKEIALRSNEDMTKESTKMLTELSNVKDLHFECDLRNGRSRLSNSKR